VAGLGGRSRIFISLRSLSFFIWETAFMKRNATAIWVGDLRGGKGAVNTESGILLQSEYFATGNCEGRGTNACELIAAAHAACFSMALANELAGAGFTPGRINISATVTVEELSAGWTITGIQLDVLADAPRAQQSDFIRATVRAKTNCMVSRLFKTNISMSARLENSDNRRAHKVRRSANG
jgi:osmotically inducible protein OsmC